MNVTLKSWAKVALVVAAIPLLLAGGLYYVLVNNLKDVLEYAIEKQTNGGYTFRSNDIKFSFVDREIIIDNSVLTRRDTANIPIYYDVKIPKAYLSAENWSDLLLHKRLSFDRQARNSHSRL